MVDEAQTRMQEATTNLLNDIDKDYLRGMQKNMHLCAANCCDRKELSMEKVHGCIESCSTPLTQAQSFVQNELSQFQERLQRCVLVCQDQVKDRVTANTSETQVQVYKSEFETCALKCVDEHIQLMPSIRKRVASSLAKLK